MWPEYFPILTKDDILISDIEYESDDGRKTSLGWLKELFLYQKIDKDRIRIDAEDRKIYAQVLDKFCRLNIIKKEQIHEWEETVSAKKQASALNKLRKSLGYTTIVEE